MRLEFIDGLRGLFALLVIYDHYNLIFLQTLPHDLYINSVNVCGFFIITGFVLSYRYWQDKNSTRLTSAALRRYFRLTVAPLTAIVIVYFLLRGNFIFLHELEKFINLPEWVRAFYNFAPSLKDALYEGLWGMYFSYFQPTSYNPVLWTMQYELKGSFLALAFLALFGRLENRTPLYLIFSVLTILIDVTYFSFLFGIWLSDKLAAENNSVPKLSAAGNFLIFAALTAGIFFAFYAGDAGFYLYDKINFQLFGTLKILPQVFYHTAGAAIIIFTVSRSAVLRKIFSMKLFTEAGAHSFSLYVLHIPILFSAGGFIFLKAINGGLTFATSVICSSIAALFITFLAVKFFNKFIDVPAGKFAKRIEKFFY